MKIFKSKTPSIWVSAFLVFCLFGCAPSIKRYGYVVNHDTLTKTCTVKMLKFGDIDTSIGVKLGSVSITDNGFSMNCDENEINDLLKKEACSLNANVVIKCSEKKPSIFGSSCYQASANLLKIDSSFAMDPILENKPKRFSTLLIASSVLIPLGVIIGIGAAVAICCSE